MSAYVKQSHMSNEPNPADDGILIVGGGMAGSLLALVLGRANHKVTIFDPRAEPQRVFRNEKLDWQQISILRELGVLSCFEEVCWPAESHPHAYPKDQRPGLTDCGAHHEDWLKAIRKQWPENVTFIEGTVTKITTSATRQTLETNTKDLYQGKLVILASGRMPGLRETLGITTETISASHSVCLGFSVTSDRFVPAQVHHIPFGSGISYVSIFPIPGEIRVNIFSYLPMTDAWTRNMSKDPLAGLADISEDAFNALGNATLFRRCEARATDLYLAKNYEREGLILLGDALHAPCPASGTGLLRILNDIKLLTQFYIPYWLERADVGKDKIKAFYRDPIKVKLDRKSLRSSLRGREVTVTTGLVWGFYRTMRRFKKTSFEKLSALFTALKGFRFWGRLGRRTTAFGDMRQGYFQRH